MRYAFAITVLLVASQAMAADEALPPDETYVQVVDGHLSLLGERQRYWGFIGHFWLTGHMKEWYTKEGDSPEVIKEKVEKGRAVIDAYVLRIRDLGFNLVRLWAQDSEWRTDYEPGDGSRADYNAYAMYKLDQAGIKLWTTSLGKHGNLEEADADLVDGPDKEAWLAALDEIKEDGKKRKNSRSIRGLKMHAWDERAALAGIQGMQEMADWPNKYKGGLRLGDDPQTAIWELTNEEWYFKSLVNGYWQKLPPFFKDELRTKWRDWLRTKYTDDAGLATAWGFLLPGESLEENSVLIAPLARPVKNAAVSDANPAALATLQALGGAFDRADFTEQRARDVMHFFHEIHRDYKIRYRDAAKQMGKGLALSPLLLDTGGGFEIQSVDLHQYGDATAMCAYIWQVAVDKQQPRFPFMSGLDEPPRLAMGVPWLEVGRIPGQPFFAYEFGTNNPDKYRAEVAYRVAALGAIQDWDCINWHIFGRPNDPSEQKPYTKRMNYSHKNVTIEGVHYKNDEVASSAMRGAAYLFRNGVIKPAPKPTHITLGADLLYDPESGDYGGSFGKYGDTITPTEWRYGLTMSVDAEAEKTTVDGPLVERGLMEANPIRPSEGLEFDWQQGHLIVDRPEGVSYTGFSAQKRSPISFANGIGLSDVTIINDPDMPYPMTEDENYLSFTVVAEDGLPLDQSKRAMVSLVSTSFNTGFSLNLDNVAKGDMPYRGTCFAGMENPKTPEGQPPVKYARVGGTVTAGPIKGMNFRFLDWHFRELGAGTVGDTLVIPADQEVFFIELTR
ncbi:MAG: hypothetical protein PF961_03270 [Planctomycetota bacterium]|jgi:hypothetical protein|nr:hypothetical protein [Planctomycetota bacterium]